MSCKIVIALSEFRLVLKGVNWKFTVKAVCYTSIS